ncbi:MAG: ATP-binding cassette domain-containing protein [Deltaproteobacteria bacterium]|jgi:phospholipid/cholesterol/gamma-HCH transport system ATP-binding protein|nr:ATP-binding cassette domain-containing protein [Deltaproteobacteria bacterium]
MNNAAMDMEPTKSWNIRLVDLTLGYEDKVILDRINASMPGGKITVILGGSGGGKSTLLRHLVGLRKPLSGKIMLDKYDLFELSDKSFRALRRRMGMLFQDGALLGSLSLADNVGLPLKEHTGLSEKTIAEVVQYNLDLVGLADYGDYYPNELSGGMRKRAGLARAMITSPPILLCDEPTSGLDPINAAQMDALLVSLKKQNPDMTIVVVSHDIESLYTIADHVMVLNNGGIAYNGSMEDLKQTKDPFLRRFLDRNTIYEETREDLRFAMRPETRNKVQNALDAWLDKG